MTPTIIIISGPGGVGKNSVFNGILKRFPKMLVPITRLTSRPRRPTEHDGGEYRFVRSDEFQKTIRLGAMLEYNLFNGHYYGVPKTPVEQTLASSRSPLLVVDVHGARAIRKKYPNQTLTIFLTAPLDQLRARYIVRGQTPAEADARLKIAQEQELPEQRWYDAVIDNPDGALEHTIDQVAKLIEER